jgi:chemotaxis protein MotB
VPRKPKVEEPGGAESAPFWMISYADMVTVLMGFFLLMFSLSTLEMGKFKRAAASFREAFGGGFLVGGGGFFPTGGGTGQGNSPYDKVSYYELIGAANPGQSVSDQRGQRGPYDRVMTLRDGDRTVAGGRVGFARGSADLSEESRRGLLQIAALLRGTPNKVEVRGHASRQPLPEGSPFRDAWDLAFARARAAADCLAQHGVPVERLRLVSCGDHEPLIETYPPPDRWRDRRVEVVMLEVTPDQFAVPPHQVTAGGAPAHPPAAADAHTSDSDRPTAQGGPSSG